MLSNDEYEILTSYIQTTQRMLELENYNLENLQFVFTELVKECDIFWPLAYGCIEAFENCPLYYRPMPFMKLVSDHTKKTPTERGLKFPICVNSKPNLLQWHCARPYFTTVTFSPT